MHGRVAQLALLALAAWGATYSRFTLGPLQETLRESLHLSDQRIAWLQGPALALPMALGAIPLGLMADRYSRVVLLRIFVAVSAVATLMSGLAPNLLLLILSRSAVGLSLAAVIIAGYSLVADLFPPSSRGRAAMIVALGEIGGAPAAFGLGGILLAVAGSDTGSDWRRALLWMGAALVPVAILQLCLREPNRVVGVIRRGGRVQEVWVHLWRCRSVIGPLLVARMMVWVADGAVLVWAAPTFSRKFALSQEHIGSLMATVLFVSGLAGPILGGPLADFCHRSGGPRRTAGALAALSLFSIPTALFALMPDVTSAAVLMTVFLTLGYTIGTAAITLATIMIPGELRGIYLAITITLGSVFFIGLAPLVVSSLSTELGGALMVGRALAIVCSIASLLGAVVLVFCRRFFPQSAQFSVGHSIAG